MSQADYFQALVQRWHEERPAFSSSIAEMIACPAYLRIIALGPTALPLILEQLRQEADDPDHWHAALEAITGENPVPDAAEGDTVQMAEAWIAWGEDRIGHFMSGVSFQNYNVATTVSLALELDDIIASPGLQGVLIGGGGREVNAVTTGPPESPGRVAFEPSSWLLGDLDTRSVEMGPWRWDSRKSLSSPNSTTNQPMQLANYPTGSGPANSVH